MKTAVRDPVELCRAARSCRHVRGGQRSKPPDLPRFRAAGYIARMRPGDPQRSAAPPGAAAGSRNSRTPGFYATPSATQPPSAPGTAPEVPRQGVDDNDRSLRRPLPLLFPAALSVRARRRPPLRTQALAEIAADATLEEVILSGGDPLTLRDAHLADLAQRLADDSPPAPAPQSIPDCRWSSPSG